MKDAMLPASRPRAAGEVQPAEEPVDTKYVMNTRNTDSEPAPPHQSIRPGATADLPLGTTLMTHTTAIAASTRTATKIDWKPRVSAMSPPK